MRDGRAEDAADGPLDVRAQRGRRGVDVQDSTGRAHLRSSSGVTTDSLRAAFPDILTLAARPANRVLRCLFCTNCPTSTNSD